MLKLIRGTDSPHTRRSAPPAQPAAPLRTGDPLSDYLIDRFDTEGSGSWTPHAAVTVIIRRSPGRGRGGAPRVLTLR